jgi:hypothetical protein
LHKDLSIQAPTLTSVTLSPSSVKGSQPSTGTVTISSAAPAGGLTVSLSASQSGATVPATVLIPAGQNHATFKVKTTGVTSKVTANIVATLGGTSKSAVLTIN